jgi:hypothetical protein
MRPTLIIALLSALFVATHIGMATARTRAWMVNRLGENRFIAPYSAVASTQFGVLLAYYAAHRFDGAASLDSGATPSIRWALIAVIAVGIRLMGGSLVSTPTRLSVSSGITSASRMELSELPRTRFLLARFCLGPSMRSSRRISTGLSSFRRWRPGRGRRTPSGWQTSSAWRRGLPALSRNHVGCHSQQSSRADSVSRGRDYLSED